MDLSSLSLPSGASATNLSSQAYTRLETVSDLHDVVYLALSGVDVAFEPVSGALSGFGRNLPVTITRRISTACPDERLERDGGGTWTITINDTPRSVAMAMRSLLRGKSSATGLCLDLTVVGPGDRSVLMESAFSGIVRMLNKRAGRILSETDISDLIGWISLLTPSQFDAQVRYGSPNWGAFMRGEPHETKGGWISPPTGSNFCRTLVCNVAPTVEDLRKVFEIGKPFGLVNAAALRQRAPWAAGLSADKTLALPQAGLAPVAAFSPSPALLPTEDQPIPRGPGRDQWLYVEARYGATWADLKTLSSALYASTHNPVPHGLQDAWADQRDAVRPYAILIDGRAGDLADLARHALSAGIHAASCASCPAPLAVVSTVVDTLQAHQDASAGLIGHSAGGTVAISVEAVPGLLASWGQFVGLELRPFSGKA